MTKVRVIRQEGSAAIVEYRTDGDVRRAIVPTESVYSNECDDDTLCAGVDYGVDWPSVVEIKANSSDVARQLRLRGIWGWEEAQCDMTEARAAFVAAFEKDIQDFLRKIAHAEV